MTLMEHWNISKCRDFGEIVFNLVDHGILGRLKMIHLMTDGGYNFSEAFMDPFLPKNIIKNRSI